MATITANAIEYNDAVQKLLEDTVKKIKEHNSNSNIAVGVGVLSTSTVVGAGLFVTGLAMIPFTFGGSVVFSVIGG